MGSEESQQPSDQTPLSCLAGQNRIFLILVWNYSPDRGWQGVLGLGTQKFINLDQQIMAKDQTDHGLWEVRAISSIPVIEPQGLLK